MYHNNNNPLVNQPECSALSELTKTKTRGINSKEKKIDAIFGIILMASWQSLCSCIAKG